MIIYDLLTTYIGNGGGASGRALDSAVAEMTPTH